MVKNTSFVPVYRLGFLYRITTKKLVIHEFRIEEVAGRGNSESRMLSFNVNMPPLLQSTMKGKLSDLLNCVEAGNS